MTPDSIPLIEAESKKHRPLACALFYQIGSGDWVRMTEG